MTLLTSRYYFPSAQGNSRSLCAYTWFFHRPKQRSLFFGLTLTVGSQTCPPNKSHLWFTVSKQMKASSQSCLHGLSLICFWREESLKHWEVNWLSSRWGEHDNMKTKDKNHWLCPPSALSWIILGGRRSISLLSSKQRDLISSTSPIKPPYDTQFIYLFLHATLNQRHPGLIHLILTPSDHPLFHLHPPRFFTSFTITLCIFFRAIQKGQKLRALLKLCLMQLPLLSTLSYYRHTEDMIVTPFAQVSPPWSLSSSPLVAKLVYQMAKYKILRTC